MTTKERILKYIDSVEGMNVSKFEKSIGVSNGYINNIKVGISQTVLKKICAVHRNVSRNWIAFGEGPMLLNLEHDNQLSEPEPTYTQKLNSKKLEPKKNTVPFFDAEATGSHVDTEMTPIHAPAGTIDIGDLLHDSQAAIRIYGNSMLPNYPPGCVVGLVLTTEGFIQPGEVYVIETTDQRLLKRLFYKDDDPDSEIITCYSDNTMKFEGGARNGKAAYPPFNLQKKDIKKLFIVTGVIKRNTNSIIMNRNN